MPVMDGLSLARELKAISPDTLVIFLSAYRSFEYAQEALDYGVRNYIVKSTKYDDLIKIFEKIRNDLNSRNQAEPHRMSAEPRIDNRIIKQVIEMIDADITKASLQYLAEAMQINPVYLSRFFKEKTGINFSDYLLKKKMETASKLLKETSYSIYEISELVGYSNDKNFSRAFKKYYGVPPTGFRHCPEEQP